MYLSASVMLHHIMSRFVNSIILSNRSFKKYFVCYNDLNIHPDIVLAHLFFMYKKWFSPLEKA